MGGVVGLGVRLVVGLVVGWGVCGGTVGPPPLGSINAKII